MTELPFQVLIKHSFPGRQTEILLCRELLRAVAGNRQIYDALWNNQRVIVKIFTHKISAKRHLNREWGGLHKLQKRGISSPAPLFFGRTEDGQWATVVEKIADSSTVLDVFNNTVEPAGKLELLLRVCRELAKQHSNGVRQKDLHLGNFLLAGNKVFTLDAGQMQFFSRQVGRKKSISQLAFLGCYVPDGDAKGIKNLLEEYGRWRCWNIGKSDEALFRKQLAAQQKKNVRRGLKKCMRTGKRHLRIKTGRYTAVFDKEFCQGTEPVEFIKRIDVMMDEGRILKRGNTCYVSKINWNRKDVVVKRYNHKGLIYSLCQTIKGSRALRGWLNEHRLGMLNIAVPRPLAYIEQHRGLLVWRSYLVTEYVQGQNLYEFLRDGSVTKQQLSSAATQIRQILDKLGRGRISHGDMKHSNILITENGVVLTDLDGMKVHKFNRTYERRRRKDISRLTRDWPFLATDFTEL